MNNASHLVRHDAAYAVGHRHRRRRQRQRRHRPSQMLLRINGSTDRITVGATGSRQNKLASSGSIMLQEATGNIRFTRTAIGTTVYEVWSSTPPPTCSNKVAAN